MIDRDLTKLEIDETEEYKQLYFEIVEKAEKLLEKYDTGEFDKYEYVSDMPPCVYKSTQYLITEKLLRIVDTEVMYQEYLRKKNGIEDLVEEAEKILAKKQILEKREEIEVEIQELLYLSKSDFELEDVKRAIYEEEETDDMQKVIAMFDTGERGVPELSTVLETVTDAWNYFPHKILGSLSPSEMIFKNQNNK